MPFPLETKLFYETSLFILGKQDNVLGYQNTLSIIDYYIQANVAIINQVGHNLQIEQPEIFSQLIIHWLNQIKQQ